MSVENYIKELVEEIEILDPSRSMYTIQLLEEEINRVRSKEKKKKEKEKLLKEEIVTMSKKIFVPVDQYPGYNFIGKLMGPKASTVRRIQNETKSTILIYGKGSTKDKGKEKMLVQTGDPAHAHFNEPLHIIINVRAFRSEAEKRMAAALAEVSKYLDPNNEEVKQESIRTLSMLNAHPSMITTPGVAPIIRVGVPPTESSSTYDPYKYTASFDGTYEGYPTTKPNSVLSDSDDSSVEESFSSKRPLSTAYPGLEPSAKKSKGSDEYDPFEAIKSYT